MAKKFHKMLSVVLAFVMVLSLCTPFMDVFAASEELTEVKQWNLVLGDEIAANFYVSVSDHVSSEAIMNVTDGYGTTSYNLNGTQKDENGNYIFTARMAAAQMGDTITLQLQDGATTGAIHTYKAVDYARVILKGNYSDNTKAMVKAMLNYGAAAQTYFGYNTENLVNVGYESTETVEIPAVEADKIVTGNVSGISFYGASLVFESKVAVRFYFNVTGNIEDYTFSTGTPVAKNGMYYVEVAGINPQQYADTIALTVNDTMTVYYSPLQYISRMYTKTENADMKTLLGAMYTYYLAAGEYETGSDMLEENAENDWTNLAVDGGMSNAASYGLTGDKTAPGSSKSLKITTNTGDVGNVHLNTTGLSQLPNFTSGMVTGWYYFGDQRPMAFLRGIDSNWNKGITGIFTFEDMGSGWYYGYVAASDLGFEVDKANTNPAEIIRLAVEIPGGYTVYVDNLKWESISVTEDVEKANDLLSVSTVVESASTITAENSTDMVSGLNSLYSKKFTAKAGVSEKKSIRYELPQSYDLTQQALSMDVHRYGVESLVAMQLSLQDSNSNTIVDVLVDNIYWLNWNHLEIDIHKYLEDGKSLSDVKYLTFTFNFDADTTIDREIYIDNVSITPYETVESVLNGTSALYIGDSISISKPFKGWAGLLEERYGVDRTNVSVGGTTFSTIGYQIKEQLKNVPEDAEFDYIILDGGCNDMYLGASSFGTVSDQPVTAAPSSFDDSTAIGGFEQLLSMLKRRFPTAKIGYIITYQRSDRWLNEFIPLAKDVCEKWGVSCLSLPDTEPFIQLFNSNFGAHTTDTVHSNVAGYELIMEYLPQWMESIPEPEIIEGFEPEKPIEVFEGGTFAAGENVTFNLNHTQPVTKMSFEYKIISGDNFYLALLPDWNSYYGYFQFNATGTIGTYEGVTTEKLSDGYVRVNVDVEKVTTVAGTPSKLITMLFIRGDWGNASGEIRDIRVNGAVEVPGPGIDFAAGANAQIDFEEGTYDFASFEYQLTSDGEMAFGLLKSDWSKFYGLFKVNANGTIQDYEGISVEKLSNGKIRVTLDLSKVQVTNNAGNRDNVPDTIGMLFIRGDWTTASGAISNLRYWNGEAGGDEGGNDENYTEIVTPGGNFAANEGITVNFEAGAYDVVTFDYQITNGGEMQVCLLSSDWGKYYGYFKFNANGLVQDYDGVSTEKLSNGYIRVTLKLADLGITNWQNNRDNAPETVGILYVRGDISNAAGSVDNIRCITGNYMDDEGDDEGSYTEIVTPGAEFTSGTNQSIYLTEGVYDIVTFDYKFTSGTKMHFALLQADWAKYYGYIKLDADGVSGSYDGVTFEKLDNGYIRVTMELAKITVTNSAYNADNAPDTIALLYIRGDWSDANGTIDNIRCLTYGN